jgi:hypothetical protein
MIDWSQRLRIDPVPLMLSSEDEALLFFVKRDLLEEDQGSIERLWELPATEKILVKQQTDGSWKYPSSRKSGHESENYNLLETYRQLRFLIEQFGMDKKHPSINKAAEYVLAHQSSVGDIRGIFGSQYAPHYTAGLLELLIKAGCTDDPRIAKCFSWFQETRQEDGGWAWPLRTAKVSYQDAIVQKEPVQSDKSKPFELMKSRFFKPDKYSDRKGADYWVKFQFPFWWANLLTTLDSLSLIGFSKEDESIRKGLEWFGQNQGEEGLWPTGYGKGKKAQAMDGWVGLAICRMLKRFDV